MRGGRYKHYRTEGIYDVLFDNALDTETEKETVVYQDIDTKKVYTKSKKKFYGTVITDGGKTVNRYEKIS